MTLRELINTLEGLSEGGENDNCEVIFNAMNTFYSAEVDHYLDPETFDEAEDKFVRIITN